jgi:hypothetical protein
MHNSQFVGYIGPLEWITACVALKWLFFGMFSLISLITGGSERHDAICFGYKS